MEHFQTFEKEEKLKFKKVKRIPAEEGVAEEFQSLDYLLMDSLGEIWILPRFLYRIEKDEEANDRRISFLEEQNLIMLDIEEGKLVESFEIMKKEKFVFEKTGGV